MSAEDPRLLLTTSPFLKHHEDTAFLMWQVNLSLIPVALAATYFFGVTALLLLLASTAGALLPEWLAGRGSGRTSSLRDGSAVITGVLLALTLPPTVPLWVAFVGGAVAIVLGKLLFGGIGYSVFNPALVGRAFLQAAFPESMTRWSGPGDHESLMALHGDLFAFPFSRPVVDTVTAATPLARMKFDSEPTAISDLLFGTTSGSLGETCTLIILLSGMYLAFRRVLNWRIPVAIFLSVAATSGLLHLADPSSGGTPLFHLFSGGLVLGAVFMATDPVTSPITQRGCWMFGIGVGVIVMIIRVYGGLPEGVMYAILLMNGMTPLINRVTQARIYGTRWRSRRA